MYVGYRYHWNLITTFRRGELDVEIFPSKWTVRGNNYKMKRSVSEYSAEGESG